MKAGYIVENQPIEKYDNAILVSNYHGINEVVNLPCMEKSSLIMIRSEYTSVGCWKIKQLKQK